MAGLNSLSQLQNKVVDMEADLQRLRNAIVKLDLVPDLKSERRKEKFYEMGCDNQGVECEIRFKRFLYYGDELPLFRPSAYCQNFNLAEVQSIVMLLARAAKELYKKDKEGEEEEEVADPLSVYKYLKTVDPIKHQTFKPIDPSDVPVLSMILEALKEPDHPYPECPVFALACVSRHPFGGIALQSAAYRMACEFVKKPEHFFLFIKFSKSYGENCPGTDKKWGWGKGLKKMVMQWYTNQNEQELAREVCHHSGYHGWTHKDVIRRAHFKMASTSVGVQAVVCYILKGLEETEKRFGDNAEAATVMAEFRKRKLELGADSDTLVRLVEAHKLKPRDLPSSKLHQGPIWCALLKNMNSREVLDHLPTILKLRIAGAEDVRKAAAGVLTKEGQASLVSPTQVYVALKNYSMSLANKGHHFNSQYLKDKRKTETFVVREPCPMIMQSLNSILAASFKAVEAGGVRLLMAVDLREVEDAKECAWTHSVTPQEAMAVTALSLARSNKRFTLTAFVEGQEMQIVSVPKSASVDTLIEKFKELQASAAKEPSIVEPINWAKERKRDLDLFVVMTPVMLGWKFKGHDIAKTLQLYRDSVKKPDARLAVWALGNMCLKVANSRNLGTTDFAGFSPKSIQVINCLCKGKF